MSQRKHSFSAEVVERNPQGIATTWLGSCGRHAKWVGSSYEVIEDHWRQHVYEEAGRAPSPHGDKSDRWMPDEMPCGTDMGEGDNCLLPAGHEGAHS